MSLSAPASSEARCGALSQWVLLSKNYMNIHRSKLGGYSQMFTTLQICAQVHSSNMVVPSVLASLFLQIVQVHPLVLL